MKDCTGIKKDGILFFDKCKLPSKWIVMHRMGVKPRSFAGKMVSRMYDYYFKGAVKFNKEFHNYYNKEYETITEYMEQHYNIPHEYAEKMSTGSFFMKRCARDSFERNIETLNYDLAFKEAFSDAVGGLIDEDKDRVYY